METRMKRQARLRVNPKDGEGPSGGYATQSTRQPRYYDRNPDAQVAYDRFYAEGVTGNENWAEFIDHDIQRLEGIISAGGLPARQAEDYLHDVRKVKTRHHKMMKNPRSDHNRKHAQVRKDLQEQFQAHTVLLACSNPESEGQPAPKLDNELCLRIAGITSKPDDRDKPLKIPPKMGLEGPKTKGTAGRRGGERGRGGGAAGRAHGQGAGSEEAERGSRE